MQATSAVGDERVMMEYTMMLLYPDQTAVDVMIVSGLVRVKSLRGEDSLFVGAITEHKAGTPLPFVLAPSACVVRGAYYRSPCMNILTFLFRECEDVVV